MKTYPIIPAAAIAPVLITATAKADHVWINEFHYDNLGGDVGEFVEIAVRSGPAFVPANFQLALYNGNGGATYGSTGLTFDTATVTGPFSILNDTETISLYTFSFPANGLQNGGAATPDEDGFAIINNTSGSPVVVQFLSYEGVFAATDGPAVGATSTDVGVFEDGSGTNTSIGYMGPGDRATAFPGGFQLIQSATSNGTPGAINEGQIFVQTPEPASISLLALGGLALAARRRRRAS